MKHQCIYETKGKAREFSELALNLYDGCSNQCVYCFAPLILHKAREAFQNPKYSRITVYDIVESARKWVGEKRSILLSFVSDPYQLIEQDTMITRKTIMALHEVGLNVTILTKGGLRSMRDFDLLTSKDAYATTLTCVDEDDSRKWEKNAAPPSERIRALFEAHERGIETWASFEPVLYPEQTKELVYMVKGAISHIKLGKLNYVNQLPPEYQAIVKDIDWFKFGWDMKVFLDAEGVKSYFKKDLLKEMKVTPENFKQTWVE